MSNTNNVMNEGLPSNVICSDPYGCTFEEIVELLGEKSGRADETCGDKSKVFV